MRTRAFTLYETLTVAMILMIVAAATYPVFFQVKARAKQTVCLSNLREIYMGVEMYESDYGELPWIQPSNPPFYENYLGGTKLQCPNARFKSAGYRITAAPFPGPYPKLPSLPGVVFFGGQAYHDAFLACRTARGADFPYVVDPNHLSAVDSYQNGGARFIIARASGAVASVPWNQRAKPVCNPLLGPEFNQ